MELQNDVSVAKEAIKELKKAVETNNFNENFKPNMENVKNEVSNEISKKKTLISFNETGYFSIPLTLLSIVMFTVGIMLVLVSGILFSFNRTSKSQ